MPVFICKFMLVRVRIGKKFVVASSILIKRSEPNPALETGLEFAESNDYLSTAVSRGSFLANLLNTISCYCGSNFFRATDRIISRILKVLRIYRQIWTVFFNRDNISAIIFLNGATNTVKQTRDYETLTRTGR